MKSPASIKILGASLVQANVISTPFWSVLISAGSNILVPKSTSTPCSFGARNFKLIYDPRVHNFTDAALALGYFGSEEGWPALSPAARS
jgi:hypothetical protein